MPDSFDGIVNQIARPGTFCLAMVVVIATFFIKRIVETAIPWWKPRYTVVKGDGKSATHSSTFATKWAEWWNEVILYAIPILVGELFGLVNSEFLHGLANERGMTRFMWSGAVAWFAGYFYKIVRKVILKKAGVDIDPGNGLLSEPPESN